MVSKRPGSGRSKGKSGARELFTKVRSAKGRKLSSTRWLQRQLNDPYVAEAKRMGYPSRAAFKLVELDEKFKFLKPGKRVVDLGAAPGGWTMVAVEKVITNKKRGKVVALDINEMDDVAGATVLQHDFLDNDAPDLLKKALDGPADIVISDMAAPATGHTSTDHIKIMALAETALDFACEVLAPDGIFIAKVLKGGTENELLAVMKQKFKTVRHAKPPASRQDSAESYVVATGFRG
ncbi:MAG: RlmE family RNA methyltransferase [Rhodospirillaceae bacterium]|nr:RlmE family RNA methyltransferase [Rhodospirillaceae bacterium]MBT4463116.1 RlmE family RNA methyltransferase [Rhodospirillaceae bacterium]MBT5013748.1 RlmE family RNA methyltransferase [Rhodospirillaceae bacterium]MBT5309488.1 RlmE family RNA methyltransferase [Rhodospirillaceae bacterium]MBT6406401.1 RlmE family RNA methyltransferase [Rhodospirillaceae bacterium]